MKATRILSLLFVALILVECLACAVPTFAAVDYDASSTGGLELGVHFLDFGMVTELEGADGKICSFDPKCDAYFIFGSEEYTPFKGYSGYYYLLNAYNAEYNYEVTVIEYSSTNYRETNRWTVSTASIDIYVRPGCMYSVYFTQGAAVVEGMYNTGLTEISFHLPEIYDVSSYSDVLEDLSHDKSFNESDYPVKSYEAFNDEVNPSLQVIQIGESGNGELFLYVYQPYDVDFIATSISMYCDYSTNGEDFQPRNYDLILTSSNGVFYKYLVKNFTVSDEAYRYYNIVSIRRAFDSLYDEGTSGTESSGNEKALSVGQQWCCYYLNDQLIYEMNTFDTLEIDVKYTGNFEFSSGITWGTLAGILDSGNSWFICFDLVDYIADHIYDADMSYTIREATRTHYLIGNTTEKLGEPTEEYITLTYNDTASYKGDGLFAKEYKWNRIMSSEEFIKNAEKQGITISENVKAKIKDSQWVFSFAETKKSEIHDTTYHVYSGYDIDDVSILRIHFLNFDDKPYNLGVVSDIVNPDNVPDGVGGLDEDAIDDAIEKLLLLVGIVLMVALLSACAPILSELFKISISLIKMLFKGVLLILSLPFKIIKKFFNSK